MRRSGGWKEIVNIGGKYNWKYTTQDQLVYIGKKGAWHQFRKIGDHSDVWCEVLDEDLHLIEETKPPNAELTGER